MAVLRIDATDILLPGLALLICGLNLCVQAVAQEFRMDSYRIKVTVTSPLPKGNVPLDPDIEFGKMIREQGGSGVLDPNSLEVFNQATGQPVPFHAPRISPMGIADGSNGSSPNRPTRSSRFGSGPWPRASPAAAGIHAADRRGRSIALQRRQTAPAGADLSGTAGGPDGRRHPGSGGMLELRLSPRLAVGRERLLPGNPRERQPGRTGPRLRRLGPAAVSRQAGVHRLPAFHPDLHGGGLRRL